MLESFKGFVNNGPTLNIVTNRDGTNNMHSQRREGTQRLFIAVGQMKNFIGGSHAGNSKNPHEGHRYGVSGEFHGNTCGVARTELRQFIREHLRVNIGA